MSEHVGSESGESRRADVTDRTLGELGMEVSRDLSKLVRQEIKLATTELRQELTAAGKGAGLLGGAGVVGLYVLGFGSLALMFGLGTRMALGWAALIVMGLWLLVSLVLALVGRSSLRRATPALEQTKLSLKEDAQWVKTRNS